MPRILVTGANGQIGTALKKVALFYPDVKFIFYSKEELDICDSVSISKKIEAFKADYFINCAAYTEVDKAESEVDKCMDINANALKSISEICSKLDVCLIHFSSDYVYHNGLTRPLKEDDDCTPQSVYANSKKLGEDHILTNCEKHIIIRTSWVYHTSGRNFVNTMLTLMQSKESLSIVSDQIGSPTNADDIASAVMHIISKIHNSVTPVSYGIYNYSNEGLTNWFEFASEIKSLANLSCKLIPIKTEEYATPAKRPSYSVLDKEKIKSTFGLNIPDWADSLKRSLEENDNL